MKNLIQSLASQRLRLPVNETQLKDLFNVVREQQRSLDTKLVDSFYDSLEAVLNDLRTVTADNRDAEAFLKPVSKTDYADYYDIITTPMDLQTMLRRVKQKHYKSKAEFQDDLDLISSNCHTYNTGENHPLRLAVNRLRAKAEVLLRNVTDRKERLDPPVHNLSAVKSVPKFNNNSNNMNGHANHLSPTLSNSPSPQLPTPPVPVVAQRDAPTAPKPPPKDLPFSEQPALVRTPTGMALFSRLDAALDRGDPGPSTLGNAASYGRYIYRSAADELRDLVAAEDSDDDIPDGSEIGQKRKIANNGFIRSRKRARRERQTDDLQELLDLWWEGVTAPALIANGVPHVYPSSSDPPQKSVQPLPTQITKSKVPAKRKTRKKKASKETSGTLLELINTNIKSLKRVRRTHDKFAALGLSGEQQEPNEAVVDVDDEVDVTVDERPWRPELRGAELGTEQADDCLHWMGIKIVEHAGFQGVSKTALSVLTGVAAEYLFNVGRTIRFLCDNYSRTMNAEEIILHTLFESGITHVQDLERYIQDDIIRYGGRLNDLEKKLTSAYHEATSVDVMDDDAFFGNEDEDEADNELLMGNFADSFGEDFLGLRELGIAADFGLSSLTIPKQLLKGKNAGAQNPHANKTKEPPLPYPPPPAFIPLVSNKLDDQIGLLKPFYLQRLNALGAYAPVAQPMVPGGPPLPGPSLSFNQPGMPAHPTYPGTNTQISHSGPTMLPDDVPDQLHTKIGPLGQILKPSASATKKSKSKAKAPPPGAVMLPGSIAGLPGLQHPHPPGPAVTAPATYLPPGMIIPAQAGRVPMSMPVSVPMMNGTTYAHMNGHGTAYISGAIGMNGRPPVANGSDSGAKKKTKK